ncbi:MAG: glycerol-3-phosphate 1-O-acyltransferase PlsY [Candidatus Eisenbacteria bacterium]|nr:glycerol-3-phosphate 1-O-acyltransferase PlsY [Candidatus Eisenbacteria bacterium]
MPTLLALVVSYLLGSIPTSDIAGRMRGVDLRSAGSGNPGFTNALRVLGPRTAVPVLIVDVAKGAAAVLLVADMLGAGSALGPIGVRLASGLAAVAGHMWPVFARFRGGKGVATACGVFLAMAPFAAGASVVVWIAVVAATRYVSVASMAAALFLPLAIWAESRVLGGRPSTALLVAGVAVAAAVVLRHRSNIRRLMDGTENRFGGGAGSSRGAGSDGTSGGAAVE